jgi:stage III sporulation protein SpoIIIAA
VDELVTRGEAGLVQTCHARGVQVVATVHADSLANVVENPVFAELMGGHQSAAVSDATAQRHGGAKFVRSRRHPPVFDGAYDVETKTLYRDLGDFVDSYFEYQNV